MGARAVGVMLLLHIVLLVAPNARADGLEYSAIDRATVRVLALGAADTVEFEEDGTRFILATPMGGHGSGFIVSSDGLIVTAAHVVAGARAVAVHAMGLMGPLPARVVHIDEMRDIALLRVSHQFTDVAQLATADVGLKIREEVYAIGYPLDATRTDPQSSRGVVSGRLPDGRLQLSISLNPGNSGGPVIGPSDQVFGVVSARADPKVGAEGLAAAVPLQVFRDRVANEIATPTVLAPLTPTDQKLADLVSLIAHEGDRLVRGSIDVEGDEAARTERQVHQLLKEMPRSADAALLGAAFYWNRHVANRVHEKDPAPAHKNAIYLVNHAVKLDPQLKRQSKFVRHVLAAREGIERAPTAQASAPQRVDEPASSIAFSSPDERVTLHVKLEEHSSNVAGYGVTTKSYGLVCQAPCDSDLGPGEYELALSKDGGTPVEVGTPVTIDGRTAIEGTYHDRTGVRVAGWVTMGVGVPLGLLYAFSGEACNPDASGYCAPTHPNLLKGTALMGLSAIVGTVLVLIPDGAEVVVTPGMALQTPTYLVGSEMDELRGLTVQGKF